MSYRLGLAFSGIHHVRFCLFSTTGVGEYFQHRVVPLKEYYGIEFMMSDSQLVLMTRRFPEQPI